jgi:uncharacterized protein YndB with AHSA1/START domain
MPQFENVHEVLVNAPAAKVHELVNDFRQWRRWSPWEEKDPELKRSDSGAETGRGAVYDWTGNKQVGTGRMTIVSSTPESIAVDLEFIEPFKLKNDTVFAFTPEAKGTHVTWKMSGKRGLFMHLAGKLFFDKAIGEDIRQGLTNLKTAAEERAVLE